MNRKKKILLLLFIFSAALVLRLPGIKIPLRTDEGRAIILVEKSFKGVIDNLVKEDAHPPLYPMVLKIWSKLGSETWFFRLLNILFGALSCILIYLIAEELFSRKTALMSSILAILSPQFIFVSQYLRSYSLGIFFTTLAAYLFILYWKTKKDRFLIGITLFSLAAIYTFYFSIFIILMLNIFVLCNRTFRDKKIIGKWLIAQALIAILYAIWLPFMIAQIRYINAGSASTPLLNSHHFGFYLGNIHLGAVIRALVSIFHIDIALFAGIRFHTLLPQWILILIALFSGAFFIFFIVLSYRYLKKNELFPTASILIVLLIFGPVFLAILTNIFLRIAINPRYFCQSSVFSLILFSIWCISFWDKLHGKLLFVLIIGFFIVRIPFVWSFQDINYKKVLKYLERDGKSNVLLYYPPTNLIKVIERNINGIELIDYKNEQFEVIIDILEKQEYFYFLDIRKAEYILKYPDIDKNINKFAIREGFKLVDKVKLDDMLIIYKFKRKIITEKTEGNFSHILWNNDFPLGCTLIRVCIITSLDNWNL